MTSTSPKTPFGARAVVALGLFVLGLGSSGSEARAQTGSRLGVPVSEGERGDTLGNRAAPVVITVSGGKSLGSYQAGLNWGLIQVMKHSVESSAEHHRLDRPYQLAAVTGASAGNINALISAAEWCDASPLRPPEESLFFKIWVRTGWEQLLAPVRYTTEDSEHQSVLHRDFFETHFEELDAALERAPARDCDIPIGITLTKLSRGSISLGQLEIPTQRFVSVVRLTTVRENGRDRLRFALPERGLRADSTLGKRVMPALEGDGHLNGGVHVIPSRAAYQLSAASSAFPLAFEPEALHVIDPETRESASCDGVLLPEEAGCQLEALYLDGGLFDNSPVDLALRLFEHRREPYRLTGADAFARLVYIEAGQYRDPLETARRRAEAEERLGIGAALQMVSEAIPAARKYELHALARSLRADADTMRNGWIRITDRGYPIVGEHLAGFASFLGRPFREFDFYVGLYDALHFIAKEMCPQEQTEAFQASGRDRHCTAEAVRSLITDPDLVLGRHAPALLARIFREEFTFAQQPRVGVPSDDRAILLMTLADAQQEQLAPRTGRDPCEDLGVVEQVVCSGGFDRILTALREDTASRRVIRDWASRPECGRDQWQTSQVNDCLADYTLRELVQNPPLFMSRTAEQVIRQLWRVEDGLKQTNAKNKRDLVQFAELWFRSTSVRYQDKWDTDPSSIPDGESLGNWFFHLAPNQLTVAAGTKGGDIWGYRPTYHFGPNWAVVAPLSLTFVRPVENTDERWRGHAGFGILNKRTGLGLSALQLTGDWLRALQWRDPTQPQRELWGVTGTAYLIGGKITASVRWIPGNESELYSGDDVAFILGVADFNGLLYWAARGLFGG